MPIKQDEMKALADAGESISEILLTFLMDLQNEAHAVALGAQNVQTLLDKIDLLCTRAPREIGLELGTIRIWQEKFRLTSRRNERNAERMRRQRARLRGEEIIEHQRVVRRASANVQEEMTKEERESLEAFNRSTGFIPKEKEKDKFTLKRGREIVEVEFGEREDFAQGAPAAPGMADLPEMDDEEDEE